MTHVGKKRKQGRLQKERKTGNWRTPLRVTPQLTIMWLVSVGAIARSTCGGFVEDAAASRVGLYAWGDCAGFGKSFW
jgi:hypothetical protein